MRKRVTQHQLEDISRAKFALALPRTWVMRDKGKDYGIDAEVELFDESGASTGFVFLVQLKATESQKRSSSKGVDVAVEAIRYYKQLELPVLIVRYSASEDCFYCKWDHQVDLYYAKKNAKTVRVTFSDADRWGSSTADRIKNQLLRFRSVQTVVTLPVSISLSIGSGSFQGVSRGVLNSEFILELGKLSHLAAYEADAEKALLNVSIQGDKFVVSLSTVAGCTFHHPEIWEEKSAAEGVADYSLLGLAAALVQLGQVELAARIFLEPRILQTFLQWEGLFKRYIPILMRTTRQLDLLDAVSSAIEQTEDNNALEIVTLASTLVSSSFGEVGGEKLEQLLKRILEKHTRIQDKTMIGMAQYNLGNHYRSRGLLRKSVRHYLLARRYFPGYLNQPYFFRELAGVLFELGRYRFSYKLYERALEMDRDIEILPLLADALMFSGCYAKSLEVFERYLGECKNDVASEWVLKAWFLQEALRHTKIECQERRPDEAKKLVDVSMATDVPAFEARLYAATQADLLCGLAWYNLGIIRSKQKRHQEAAFAFVACGLSQSWDVEGWVNAVLSCLNNPKVDLFFIHIINAAYHFNGDEFARMLHQRLETSLSGSVLEDLSRLLDEMMPRSRRDDLKPALRFLHEDGVMRDVFSERDA